MSSDVVRMSDVADDGCDVKRSYRKDTTQQLCCALFQAVWTQFGSTRLLWERMRALFDAYALTSMRQLCEALFYGFQKSSPLVMIAST